MLPCLDCQCSAGRHWFLPCGTVRRPQLREGVRWLVVGGHQAFAFLRCSLPSLSYPALPCLRELRMLCTLCMHAGSPQSMASASNPWTACPHCIASTKHPPQLQVLQLTKWTYQQALCVRACTAYIGAPQFCRAPPALLQEVALACCLNTQSVLQFAGWHGCCERASGVMAHLHWLRSHTRVRTRAINGLRNLRSLASAGDLVGARTWSVCSSSARAHSSAAA